MTTSLLNYQSRFTAGFFGGSSTSNLVPSVYPVALDGHPYQVIWDHDAIGVWGARFKGNSLPVLRTQADQSNIPGEQSISPEAFWRRSQENFISGSGQFMQDRNTSIGTRFYSSKGINCWTPYQLFLLNDTTKKRSSANTGLQVMVNGTSVYMIDGTSLYVSTDSMATWTAVTGIVGTPVSMCSDGLTVYVATATALYTVSGSVGSSYIANAITLLGFVKGRLMAANGLSIYNITTNSLPSALLTKASGWTWVGFAGGQSQIYAAGYAGEKSLIYRTAIVAEGTTLAAPIVACSLPDGEIVRSIYAYMEFVVVGSDLGIRFCSVASDGSLTIGPLISTNAPVYAAKGYSNLIWYGLSNFDSISSGLGCMSPRTLTDTLAPAYASDLMATGTTASPVQGDVRSIATFSNYRIFTVDGQGLYAEALNTPVASGTITSGWVGYGISDPKVAVFLDLKHEPLNGTISAYFAADNGPSVYLGKSDAQGTSAPANSLQTNQTTGLQFQLVFVLTPTANVSPKLTRWTLRSYPAPTRSTQFQVPIALFEALNMNGKPKSCDIVAEFQHLRSLLKSQRVFPYQEGNQTYQVVMFDQQFLPEKVTKSGDMQGVFLAYLNEITE